VTKTEYQPVTWPTDDAYWCGDAGLRSERKPDYHSSDEKCIVAADPDPPAVIQQLTLLPTNATADPTGRQLKLTILRKGILRLTYDPAPGRRTRGTSSRSIHDRLQDSRSRGTTDDKIANPQSHKPLMGNRGCCCFSGLFAARSGNDGTSNERRKST
jgi:hypothetical protein